ncbi:hypothetical protein C2G38_2237276, partial [Gigaspora rosea]
DLREDYKYCKDSFIFSLKNGTIQNSILSRVIDPEHAILSIRTCGPYFGQGYDLAMWHNFNEDKNCWNNQSSYDKRIRNTSTYDNYNRSYFKAAEYEIFRLARKLSKN